MATNLPVWQGTVQDTAGNAQASASVEFRRESDLALPTLYTNPNGTGALGNPAPTNSSGRLRVHLASGVYKITATKGAFQAQDRYVEIGHGLTSLGARQSVTGATATVADDTGLLTIERAAPATTGLTLPSVANRDGGLPLVIADYSTSVTGHAITLTPAGSEKIMGRSSWEIDSTADNLGSLRLTPASDLSGWVIG